MALRNTDEFKVHQTDSVVTDPTSDDAVQIPDSPLVDASNLGADSVHEEPSPNEVAEKDSKPSRSSKSSE
jgi:hypothetical protein